MVVVVVVLGVFELFFLLLFLRDDDVCLTEVLDSLVIFVCSVILLRVVDDPARLLGLEAFCGRAGAETSFAPKLSE